MENLNENLVQVAENVDQTTEQIEVQEQAQKTYTQDELDAIVGKRIARNTAKIRKEYEKKYGELETVLKAGTGKEDLVDMTNTFRQFYEEKGVKIPQKPNYSYSDKDLEVLAEADAREYADYEDVKEELDRLADIGVANMTAREKALFRVLADREKNTRESKELAKIGVTEDVYGSKEFKDFAKQFNANTPITTIYNIYNKTKPQKEIKTMGSMKTNTPQDAGVKEFYTVDEARRFTKKDFDKNPALYDAVQRSMLKWGRK
jgi:hypothetical protein